MLPERWNKEIINIHQVVFKGNMEVNWVDETAKQLIKDFTMLDIPLELKPLEENPYQDLFSQVRYFVQDLFEKHHSVYLNLMYRIDLPEDELKSITHNAMNNEVYDQITELILYREFMKVVYRNRYSH